MGGPSSVRAAHVAWRLRAYHLLTDHDIQREWFGWETGTLSQLLEYLDRDQLREEFGGEKLEEYLVDLGVARARRVDQLLAPKGFHHGTHRGLWKPEPLPSTIHDQRRVPFGIRQGPQAR